MNSCIDIRVAELRRCGAALTRYADDGEEGEEEYYVVKKERRRDNEWRLTIACELMGMCMRPVVSEPGGCISQNLIRGLIIPSRQATVSLTLLTAQTSNRT